MFNYEKIISAQQQEDELINALIYCNDSHSAENLFFRFLDLAENISEKDKALSILLNNVIERKKNYDIEVGHKIIEAFILNERHLVKFFNINELLKKSIYVLHSAHAINYRSLYKIFDLLSMQKDKYLDVMNYIIETYFKLEILPMANAFKYLKTRGNLFRYTVQHMEYDLKAYAKHIKSLKSRIMPSVENQIQRLVEAKRAQHEHLPMINYNSFSDAVIKKHFKFFDKEDDINFWNFLKQKSNTAQHPVTTRNIMHKPIESEMFKQMERISVSSKTVFVIPCIDDYMTVGAKYSFYDITLGTALSYISSSSHNGEDTVILLYSSNGIESFTVQDYRSSRKKFITSIVDKMITQRPPDFITLPDIVDLLLSKNKNINNIYIFGSSNIVNNIQLGSRCRKTKEILCLKRLNEYRRLKYDKVGKCNVFIHNPKSISKYFNNFNVDIYDKNAYLVKGFSTNYIDSLSKGYIDSIVQDRTVINYTNYYRNGILRGTLL